MLYNALPARFVRYDNNGLMQEVALNSAKDAKDIVYDTMLRRLGAYADEDAIVIDGKEASLVNLQKYIGAYVTVYRDEDEKGDILAINEVKSVFINGNFDFDSTDIEADEDDIKSCAIEDLISGDVKFTDDDDVTYTIKSDAYEDIKSPTRFTNGGDANFSEVNDDDDYTLAVEISGKRITGLYSISTWNIEDDDTHRSKVEKEDLDLIEEDHELLGVAFEEDKDDEIDLTKFSLLGVNSLDDIKEDHIVYVYQGKDIIYVWNDDDEEWEKGSTSAFRDEDYTNITFYDVVDTDGVFDIVLVK